jgi:PLP dependent protein
MASIYEKVRKLKDEIDLVCSKAGRDPGDVTITAATKYANVEQINEAIKAGIKVIGENRIQDAQKKFGALLPVKKHFIGHLQTNKTKDAVRLFDCIESIDSYRLAEMVNIEAERALKKMPVLVEVNIAEDPKKYGVSPDEIRHFLRKLDVFKYLEVKGLMAIVPFFEDAERVRLHFRKMKELFDDCRRGKPHFNVLSMGMTNDFKAAIEEGATEVRIGSYLFK